MIKCVSRIDYYSVMLYDCSLASIFRKFNINFLIGSDLPFVVEDCHQVSVRSVMYRTGFFRVLVSLSDHRLTSGEFLFKYEHMNSDQRLSFFTQNFASIKVEAAGVELNNLRKSGFNVEENFMNRLFWLGVSQEFKVTRCDFAFDFIDHPTYSNFPQLLARYLCLMKYDQKLRLCTSNKRDGGLVYDVVFNPSATCSYLGSRSSNEFVRVYDKKQEMSKKVYKTEDSNSWPEDAEFRACKSWCRVELQTRREKSARYLFSEGDYQTKIVQILKHVFTDFMVTDSDHVPEDFLKEYFDLSKIQNIDFVQFDELSKYVFVNTPIVQLQNWLLKNMKYLISYLSLYGSSSLIDMCNDYYRVMYCSGDALSRVKLQKLNLFLSELLLESGISWEDLPGSFVDDNGFRYLKG